MTDALDRIVVAADGTFAAVIQTNRICVLELPSAAELWEIGTDAAADAVDAAWVGSPPRLLVLSRFAEWSTVHLLDVRAADSVGELKLASPARMLACVGHHALVVGDNGAAILTTAEHLALHQFPARTLPIAAGAAANQFVVAVPGVIEEWDPHSRVPKRRLRLPRPTTITAVGGSERVVWIATLPDRTRIDVMPLINRGQPKSHELPEAIATVSGHPRSDVLVCVGQLGRAYAVDLDGRTRLRALAFPDIDRVEAAALVMGRTPGVIAAQRGRPFRFVQLDVREAYVGSGTSVPARAQDTSEPVRSTLGDESAPLSVARTPLESPFSLPKLTVGAPVGPEPVASVSAPAPASTSESAKTAKNLAARFAAVRERREAVLSESGANAVPTDMPQVATPPPSDVSAAASGPIASVLQAAASLAKQFIPSTTPAPPPRPAPTSTTSPSWRTACADWAESVVERRTQLAQPPSVEAIRDLAVRFDLSAELVPALALLYGAHLAGHDGVAPVVLANAVDFVDERRWAEALGRGELAAMEVASYEGSRVRLAPIVRRVLDELPPATGTLVGAPSVIAVLGACVLVERGSSAIDIATQHAARAGGAILVGHDERTSAEVCFEARAIGAVAMVPASKFDGETATPVIYVADDEGDASKLGLPRFA
ncbi:MAG: hypothetical protein M4D80_04215 [Myxococcota bacterium]|nr:hypothetical protein [Myxococcota bacterium]